MYAKTRPTATGALTRKQKRIFAIVGVVVILVLGRDGWRLRRVSGFRRHFARPAKPGWLP